jgi:multiple sugar transport system substrate-binding protein
VDWDARPLKDFEDQPLEELAAAYDLVLMDYPFVGTAAESGMIVAANDWADVGYMQDQAEHSVGPSFSSYTWSGMQWALAIDAAAQVSASRPDLLASSGAGQPPETWEAVLALAKETLDSPSRIALPLNPNHAYCAFLSVGIAQSGPGFWQPGHHVETASAAHALEYLRELSSCLHPLSQHADPIAISDRMSGSNEILFVPLMFGYSNYSRQGFRDYPIRFGNAPSGASGKIGSVLGGVGVAVSSLGTRQADAASLARLLVSPDIQAGLYVQSGGQPGHAAAWDSDSANALVDDFFRATRDTMQQAFLRPRVAGHRLFQELAGVLISQFIWQGEQSAADCLAEFNRLTDKLLGAWV